MTTPAIAALSGGMIWVCEMDALAQVIRALVDRRVVNFDVNPVGRRRCRGVLSSARTRQRRSCKLSCEGGTPHHIARRRRTKRPTQIHSNEVRRVISCLTTILHSPTYTICTPHRHEKRTVSVHVLEIVALPGAAHPGTRDRIAEFLISLATRIWPKTGCSGENCMLRASTSGTVRFARIGFLRELSRL